MSWFYGLVKKKNGMLSIWEITETEVNKKEILWAHSVPLKWMLSDFWILIKDLYGQYKYLKRLWTEEEFKEGNKKIFEYFSEISKEAIKIETFKY